MTLAEYYDRVSRACPGSLLTLSRETDYEWSGGPWRHWVAELEGVQGRADTPEAALLVLLDGLSDRHRNRIKWEQERLRDVRAAIDELEGDHA